jgi:hypothetical protein
MHPAKFFKLVGLNGAGRGFVPEIVQADYVNQRDSGSFLFTYVGLQSHVWNLGFFLSRAANLFRGDNPNRPRRRTTGVYSGEGSGGVGEEFRVISSD